MENLIGKTLSGRFHIQEFLGRGGMAEVYKVWDARRSTYLAIKILNEDLALDKMFSRRFSREAETLAKLQHPSIVRFYGFEKEGRIAYIVLDYVEGETLKHVIHDSDEPIPLYRILEIFRAICGALQFAHQEGLIHCDIKPANIMFNKHNEALLADFGIGRATDSGTVSVIGLGTPAYMAPEQIRMEDPKPYTDIYALGIVLYEMLTGGERPFTGEKATGSGSTSEKVRWEQLELDPPSPKKWNKDIPQELESIVIKCLEKDPANRYSSAIELLNALERAIGHEVPKVKPAARKPDKPKPAAKKSSQPNLFLIAIVVIALGLVYSINKDQQNSSSPRPTETPVEDSTGDQLPPTEIPIKPTPTEDSPNTQPRPTEAPTNTQKSPTATYTSIPRPPISDGDFISPDGSFSITLPGEPNEIIQPIDTLVGSIDMIMYLYEVDFTTAYAVAYGDYPLNLMEFSDPDLLLDGARDGAVQNVNGTLSNEQSISYEGYPGRDLEIISFDGSLLMRAQIYLVENRLYQLLYIVSSEDGYPANIDDFFNSFAILEFPDPISTGQTTPVVVSDQGIFTSPDGSFSIYMPGETQETVQSIDTLVGPVELMMYIYDEITIAYFVAYSDYPVGSMAGVDPGVMIDGAKQGVVDSMGGTISNERPISIDGYQGEEFEFDTLDGTIKARARIFMVENRMYQILLLVESSLDYPEDTDSFFNSFTLLD